jgi:hypothetical protein
MNVTDIYGQEITEEGIRELLKSLEANEGVTDVAQLRGASALQPQSLEASVVTLLFDQTYFKALNRIPRAAEKSTLIEYSVRSSYGQQNRGGFVGQAENPRQADPNFQRRTERIKYLRELWSISSVLAATQTISNPETEAVDASTMRLLESGERGFFNGNEDLIPEEWNGLRRFIVGAGAGNERSNPLVIDMRGAGITESILKQACKTISLNFGLANDMYMSFGLQNYIDNLLGSSQQRYLQNAGQPLTFDLGYSVPGFKATFALNGRITFIPDYFIDKENEAVPLIPDQNGNLTEGATSDMAPATPSAVALAIVSGNPLVTDSLWAGSGVNPSGNPYSYRILAENRQGKSKACALITGTPATAGGVQLTITDNSVTNFADSFRIYRETATGNGIFRFIKRVAKSTNPTTVFVDQNHDLAGTTECYLGDFNSRGSDGPYRTTRFKELVGFHKTRYSVIGPFLWGAVNWYAAPVFYAPRFILFKNVALS